MPVAVLRLSAAERHELAARRDRRWGKDRRDRNKATGQCINSGATRPHGQATHGVLCQSCRETHSRSR